MIKMLSSFLDLVNLKMEVNRLFEAIHGLHENDIKELEHGNPYDVLETDDTILVKIELPGVDRQSISIESMGQTLSITGTRNRRGCTGIVAYHQMERERGSFTLCLHIDGPFDSHNAGASLVDGILTIHLPRLHERRGRSTKICLVD